MSNVKTLQKAKKQNLYLYVISKKVRKKYFSYFENWAGKKIQELQLQRFESEK